MAIYLLPFYIKTGSEKIIYLERAFESSMEKGTSVLFYLYLLHIGLYMFFGYSAIKKQSQSYGNYNSNERARSLILSLKGLYGVFAVISILSFLLCLFLDLTNNYFSGYIFYTFSWVVLFVVLLQFYLYYQGNEALLNKAIKKPPSKFNQQADHSALISRMEALMEEKKLYRNAELKIMEVAHEVGVNLHTLSAAINQYYGHNFFDYINKLRVEELKTTLLDTSKNHLTLLAIARESGFQSNSSFYRVFKKHTGLTPKEYIKSQREENIFSKNILSSNSREG
ncbi:MAG: helix-turn-helix domain-containing protein [Flavobacteriaceae bacterium]|nr:helix-turn-helix domain-containing protein [Flavobacteriaceae bacterium]